MKRRLGFLIAALVALILAGCANLSTPSEIAATFRIGTPSPTPEFTTRASLTPDITETATVTAPPSATTTSTETSTVTSTPTETATVTSTVSLSVTPNSAPKLTPINTVTISTAICPPVQEVEEAFLYFDEKDLFSADWEHYPITKEVLLERSLLFLNAGGTPSRLADVMESQSVRMSIQVADLDANGTDEIFISTTVSGSPWVYSVGLLYCDNGQYVSYSWFAEGNDSVNIQLIEDVNNDGHLEFIIEDRTRTVENCATNFQVLGWRDNTVVQFLEEELGCSVNFYSRDNDGDDIKELIVQSSRPDSSILPSRLLIYAYKYNQNHYIRLSEVRMPPTDREDYLEDANIAIENGEYEKAIEYYKNILYENGSYERYEPYIDYRTTDVEELFTDNPSIENVLEEYLERNAKSEYYEYQSVMSFSFFRLMSLYYALGEPQSARSLLTTMQMEFTDKNNVPEFRHAAEIFVQSWSTHQDAAQACEVANQFLASVQSKDYIQNFTAQYSYTFNTIHNSPNWCSVRSTIRSATPIATPVRVSTFTPTPIPTLETGTQNPNSSASVVTANCPITKETDETVLYFDQTELFNTDWSNDPITRDRVLEKILIYLNNGGDPTLIEQIMKNQSVHVPLRMVDLDLDGTNELLITLSPRVYDAGKGIALVECRDGKYVFVDWIIQDTGAIAITFIGDINNDTFPEVMIENQPNASTCLKSLQITGWRNGEFVEFLYQDAPYYSSSIILHCPGNFYIRDLDKDGIKEIKILGDRAGYAWETPRDIIYTYIYQQDHYVLTNEVQAPPTDVTHFVEDANVAIDVGDLATAIGLYEYALDEENFTGWDPVKVEALFTDDPTIDNALEEYLERNTRSQYDQSQIFWSFAYFRLASLYYVTGNTSAGVSTVAIMTEKFTEERGGIVFRKATEIFVQAWFDNQNPTEACQKANEFVNATERTDNFDAFLRYDNYAFTTTSEEGQIWCPF